MPKFVLDHVSCWVAFTLEVKTILHFHPDKHTNSLPSYLYLVSADVHYTLHVLIPKFTPLIYKIFMFNTEQPGPQNHVLVLEIIFAGYRRNNNTNITYHSPRIQN